MPINLTDTIKTTSGFSFASKGMNNIFINKFYTSAVLTIMIIILIMIIYPCKKNTPSYILGKLGFYIFIATMGVFFIHDCIVYNNYNLKKTIDGSDKFIDNIGSDDIVYGISDHVKVKIGGDEMVGFGECSGITGGNTDNDSVGGNTDDVFALYGV